MRGSVRGFVELGFGVGCLVLAACAQGGGSSQPSSALPRLTAMSPVAPPIGKLDLADIKTKNYSLIQDLSFADVTPESYMAFGGKSFDVPMLRFSKYFRLHQQIPADSAQPNSDYCRFYIEIETNTAADLTYLAPQTLSVSEMVNFSVKSEYAYGLGFEANRAQPELMLECHNVPSSRATTQEIGNILQISNKTLKAP